MSGRQYAYRVIYEDIHGPIPDGLVAHHRCENPQCVNPEHIELITQGEHIAEHGLPGDWGQSDKTHCPAGHPYDETNTYHYTRKDGRRERHCRECRRAARRRHRAKF